MKFDCGNRTEDCDNATTCPCLNFIQKEVDTYSEGLKSDLWKKIEEEINNDQIYKSSDELWEKCAQPGVITEEDLQDYNLTTLNHNIETCYRYLGFIEDFLERYDESTNGKFMDNTDYDSWIAALRGNLCQIIREVR